MARIVTCTFTLSRSTRAAFQLALLGLLCVAATRLAIAQPPAPPDRTREPLITPSPETQAKVDTLIVDMLEPEISMELDLCRSKLVRTRRPVTRFSITNPEIIEVVQFSPTEFELIGGQSGETTLTLWFEDQALRYLVRVSRDEALEDRTALEYGVLQNRINELFPNSMIQLIPVADKLIVRGQARDAEEATQILAVLGSPALDQTGRLLGPGSFVDLGTAARPSPDASDLPASNIISLLDVPGEQQVMLKVRVAELTRLRGEIGADLIVNTGDFSWTSLLSVDGAFEAILDTDDVTLALSAISSNAYSKILAEPNLVTLNGQTASFLAGGEFAVPTVVGVEGAAAATTSFRGFGTQLTFTPTIIDKDRIRLVVSPSLSSLNDDASVGGIPGLNSRTVETTVDLREGQWLAIAGLIQDQQAGGKARVPLLGDIPILDTIFSQKKVTREETELIVLVSPELIHPLEHEEVPLVLPGMEVTEPCDWDIFLFGRYEGVAHCDHRSTVWPVYRDDILRAKFTAMNEARQQAHYERSEEYYVHKPHGFSK